MTELSPTAKVYARTHGAPTKHAWFGPLKQFHQQPSPRGGAANMCSCCNPLRCAKSSQHGKG